jgi:hypothetical protein
MTHYTVTKDGVAVSPNCRVWTTTFLQDGCDAPYSAKVSDLEPGLEIFSTADRCNEHINELCTAFTSYDGVKIRYGQPYWYVVANKVTSDIYNNIAFDFCETCDCVTRCGENLRFEYFSTAAAAREYLDSLKRTESQLHVETFALQKTVHQLMLEHLALQPGDRVRVTRKAKTLELGWDSFWLPEMDQYVGKELEVVAVRGCAGIHCNDYLFPAHVLEVISRAERKRTVHLSEHFQATVSEKGMTIHGCLITREKFLELHTVAREVGFIS